MPRKVLVLEDSATGATAALAASMQDVTAPDPRMDEDSMRRATASMNTLMDFKAKLFGLPPFEDGPNTGADRIGRHLQAHGIPMGVTTISKRPSFDVKMTPNQHLLTLFHHVVCSGGDPEVNRGKPQLDIFLVAASRFDEKTLPEKVLVFECSPMGVEAALAAGMQVFMVAESRVDEENARHATVHLTTLLEFKPELFGVPSFPDSPNKN
ncbi:pseudouridine-5'-phosphatase-like [Dermacentor variabilis]|uniref:pseudouridine-5'-phosphatase-like n=1 Tax=Dermacentor variabilis TaxID=34621 RepID=UPI003F5C94EE